VGGDYEVDIASLTNTREPTKLCDAAVETDLKLATNVCDVAVGEDSRPSCEVAVGLDFVAVQDRAVGEDSSVLVPTGQSHGDEAGLADAHAQMVQRLDGMPEKLTAIRNRLVSQWAELRSSIEIKRNRVLERCFDLEAQGLAVGVLHAWRGGSRKLRARLVALQERMLRMEFESIFFCLWWQQAVHSREIACGKNGTDTLMASKLESLQAVRDLQDEQARHSESTINMHDERLRLEAERSQLQQERAGLDEYRLKLDDMEQRQQKAQAFLDEQQRELEAHAMLQKQLHEERPLQPSQGSAPSSVDEARTPSQTADDLQSLASEESSRQHNSFARRLTRQKTSALSDEIVVERLVEVIKTVKPDMSAEMVEKIAANKYRILGREVRIRTNDRGSVQALLGFTFVPLEKWVEKWIQEPSERRRVTLVTNNISYSGRAGFISRSSTAM